MCSIRSLVFHSWVGTTTDQCALPPIPFMIDSRRWIKQKLTEEDRQGTPEVMDLPGNKVDSYVDDEHLASSTMGHLGTTIRVDYKGLPPTSGWTTGTPSRDTHLTQIYHNFNLLP